MSTTKLNPIYSALDAHQFSRAIKLAAALPDSNVLGKALLAHAYTRSNHRHSAILTLNKILGESFYEIQQELNFDLESTQERHRIASGNSAASPAPEPTSSSGNKKGKKGKKKPAAAPPKQQTPSPAATLDIDLIDQLNTAPSLPEKLDAFPPVSEAITDETTLATLAVSLQSLKCPLTTYQLYARAASASPTEVTLRKTFNYGLHVLAAPPKWNPESQARLEAHILSNMQSIALQYARFLASSGQPGFNLATAWVAQVALWQLQWLPEDDQRQQILPRLAESMARRIVDGENANGQRSAETRLLYLRILESQSKWEDMLQILEHASAEESTSTRSDKPPPSPEFGMALTKNQILNEKARILRKLGRCKDCREVFEMLLLENPDDWSCWKGHLESSIFDDSIDSTQSLVEKILKDQECALFPMRGPHLILVEIAIENVRKSATTEAILAFGDSIQKYAETFAPRLACAYSDLETYVSMMLRTNEEAAMKATAALLEFAEKLRKDNATANSVENGGHHELTNKERQSKLRAYTFAVKLTHQLVASRSDLSERYLPDWKEMLEEWRTSLSLIPSSGGEEVSWWPCEERFLQVRTPLTMSPLDITEERNESW